MGCGEFMIAEALHAAAPQDRLEESADVYEVLLAICTLLGCTMTDVEEAAATKRTERCGFEERMAGTLVT